MKKKPREFWINEYKDTGGFAVHLSRKSADSHATENRKRCIHVRQVKKKRKVKK